MVKLNEYDCKNLSIDCTTNIAKLGTNDVILQVKPKSNTKVLPPIKFPFQVVPHEVASQPTDIGVDIKPISKAARGELSQFAVKMGKSLYLLLQNIHKLPSSPPTRNPNIIKKSEKYREILIHHLEKIDDISKFNISSEEFLPINFNDTKEKQLFSTNVDQVPKCINETELLKLSNQDFESKKEEIIKNLANHIILIYNEISNVPVVLDIARRKKYRYFLLILECYHKIEIYCNLYKKRIRGRTIKSQAKKWIINCSKTANESQKLNDANLSLIIKGAVRIKRLVEIAQENLAILDAFDDLETKFFTTTFMNVVNFERWLKLVETNTMIFLEEGQSLYEKYKAEVKKERLENLKKIYDLADLQSSMPVIYDNFFEEE